MLQLTGTQSNRKIHEYYTVVNDPFGANKTENKTIKFKVQRPVQYNSF